MNSHQRRIRRRRHGRNGFTLAYATRREDTEFVIAAAEALRPALPLIYLRRDRVTMVHP